MADAETILDRSKSRPPMKRSTRIVLNVVGYSAVLIVYGLLNGWFT